MKPGTDPAVVKRLAEIINKGLLQANNYDPLSATASRIAEEIAAAQFTDIAPNGGPPKVIGVLSGQDLKNALHFRHEILQKEIGDAARNLSATGLLPQLVEQVQDIAAADKALLKSRDYAFYEVKNKNG